MKLNTRLRVTFASIIILPLLLTVLAFFAIGISLVNMQNGKDITDISISTIVENIKDFVNSADRVFNNLKTQQAANSSIFEDKKYWEEISRSISFESTFIIVRKGDEVFYSGNMGKAKELLELLPAYEERIPYNGKEMRSNNEDLNIRKLDFVFSDGGFGSVFVVSKQHPLISRYLLIYMFISIFVILIFTSIMLTEWMKRGVIRPIDELNYAMRQIKDGNFEYVLQTDVKGEIGDLYRNYEDMRLRLKETTEENLLHEKQSKELISNISHDLKTPITSIKGYVEGIMDGVADTPQKMDKYIKTIYNKANDMDRLINELTLYSRFDNNRIPYDFHKISVADYFGDCVEEVGLDLDSKNIQLNYSNFTSSDTVVIADPEQMKKVINNIIGNSVKYMDKPNGVIDIRILDEVDSVRVEIEDNGKGIAKKDLQKIFDRFFRTDASRNSAQGGSGIGLSIVKKIVEDHGGYIWATSTEGEGTCIHFVLKKYMELPVNEVKGKSSGKGKD